VAGGFAVDPSRFARVLAESGAVDFSPVAERVRRRRGRVVYTEALRVVWAGLSPWSVVWNVRGIRRIRIGWPQRHYSTGRLAGGRDDDVRHQLHAFEQDLAAVVGEAVVATAPKAAWQQVAEQQPEEVGAGQAAGLQRSGFCVAVAKTHVAVVGVEDVVFAQHAAEKVAGQIAEARAVRARRTLRARNWSVRLGRGVGRGIERRER